MRKVITALALCLGVSITGACTQHSAPEVAHYNNQRISVRAEVEPGAFDGLLKVYFDEELVVNQRSKAFGGSSQSFNGSWRGKPVVARATLVQNFLSSYTRIDVFVDGHLIETLTV